MRIMRGLLLFLMVGGAFADEATEHKNNAMLQLESAFTIQSNTFSTESATHLVSWPAGLDVAIDNKWQFNFKSKQPVNISRIAVAIDDTVMANQVNLEVQPHVTAHYFFSDVKLQQVIQSYTRGYSFLGVYKQIMADNFADFATYRYKKLQVTITWGNANKIYNQSVINFMLVMAK